MILPDTETTAKRNLVFSRRLQIGEHAAGPVGLGQHPHEYWCRFVDEDGERTRIGRTLTAPAPDDARPVALRVRQLPERAPDF